MSRFVATMTPSNRTQVWLNKLEKTMLRHEVARFIAGDAVEIGYRSTCGCTDQTMKEYEIFRGFLKALNAQGVNVIETPVKHKNAWATNNGGFWNSYIFQVS